MQRNVHPRLRLGALAAALLLGLVGACGDDGGSSDADLPAPPSGLATIGGTVTLDGEPEADVTVRLYDADDADAPATSQDADAAGSDESEALDEATTAADGAYVFESVEPGDYLVGAGVTAEGLESSPGFPIDVDRPCRADGFTVMNAQVENETTGEYIGWMASATTIDEDAIELEAGDRVAIDIAFVCDSNDE